MNTPRRIGETACGAVGMVILGARQSGRRLTDRKGKTSGLRGHARKHGWVRGRHALTDVVRRTGWEVGRKGGT